VWGRELPHTFVTKEEENPMIKMFKGTHVATVDDAQIENMKKAGWSVGEGPGKVAQVPVVPEPEPEPVVPVDPEPVVAEEEDVAEPVEEAPKPVTRKRVTRKKAVK
jgi:hypothetical protein